METKNKSELNLGAVVRIGGVVCLVMLTIEMITASHPDRPLFIALQTLVFLALYCVLRIDKVI